MERVSRTSREKYSYLTVSEWNLLLFSYMKEHPTFGFQGIVITGRGIEYKERISYLIGLRLLDSSPPVHRSNRVGLGTGSRSGVGSVCLLLDRTKSCECFVSEETFRV